MTTAAEPVIYPDGTPVRVRVGYPAHHFRTPAYIQGHTGTVDALVVSMLIRNPGPRW